MAYAAVVAVGLAALTEAVRFFVIVTDATDASVDIFKFCQDHSVPIVTVPMRDPALILHR